MAKTCTVGFGVFCGFLVWFFFYLFNPNFCGQEKILWEEDVNFVAVFSNSTYLICEKVRKCRWYMDFISYLCEVTVKLEKDD